MHDIADLEKKGVPCAALVSSAFVKQARWQAERLGLEGIETLLVGVEHPFSNQNLEQIRIKTDHVFEDAVKALKEVRDVGDVTRNTVDSDDEEEEDMGVCNT
mmetsp:Transcript_17774/g.23530  ORF Transcript_17774/g.23530 Transcript_17774/m.23530 type:complete len:102 (+) Transcript_17774:599-904(+)|eukprot:15359455-Ditylum_brightwellii.AAC.1